MKRSLTKIAAFLLAVALCLSCTVFAVPNEEMPVQLFGLLGLKANAEAAANEDDFYYSVNNEGTITITGYKGEGGKVVVPSKIDGKKVTEIGDYAFADNNTITEVSFPNAITKFGDYVFYYCMNLTAVNIPSGITSISNGTFVFCSHLASVDIPDSVTTIGYAAFYDCDKLTSLKIPDSVTSIGGNAFYGCSILTSMIIGKGITLIDRQTFYNCNNLTYIFYTGSENDWKNITIDASGNDPLENATIYYNCNLGEHTHVWDDGIIPKLELISVNYKIYTCTICGNTKIEYLPHDHRWIPEELILIQETECVSTSIQPYFCLDCGITKTETINNLENHTWGSGVLTQAPTITSEGIVTFTCTVCGNTKTESIPKLSGSDGSNNGGNTGSAVINTDTVKEQNGLVYAASKLTAEDVIKAAGTGTKIFTVDGKELKTTDKVGSGMTLQKADGTKITIIVKGDNNGDGEITTMDARYALRTAVGLEKPNDWRKTASEIDGKGDVSTSDARFILRAAVGLDTLAIY